jgi:hypothetical protein
VYVPAPSKGGLDAGDDAAVDGGTGSILVDRAGRPLVSALLVPGVLQDAYNAQSSFDADVPRLLSSALEARLELFDALVVGDAGPDPIDWPVPDGGTHPLLPMFLGDTLLVDTALPCTSPDGGFAASYLAIEREIFLAASPHTTCGGRTPADNVVDTTLTLLVTAGRDGGPPVTQGAFGPTKPAATRFPYLADPN